MEAHAPIPTEELERLNTQPEVLVAIMREQARLIEKLRVQNKQLSERVRELEEQTRERREVLYAHRNAVMVAGAGVGASMMGLLTGAGVASFVNFPQTWDGGCG